MRPLYISLHLQSPNKPCSTSYLLYFSLRPLPHSPYILHYQTKQEGTLLVFIAIEMSRLLILPACFLSLVCLTSAYEFYVGGSDGWVPKPAKSYKLWAEKMRFQVKDKLVFKYKKGEDSVLLVKKEDYHSCNAGNPINKFDDGDSVFMFDRSGPFFFISGAAGHCAQGEKLEVVVMSDRKKPVSPPTSSPPASAPASSPPSPSLPSVSPSPGPTGPTPSSAQVKFAAKLSIGLLALFFVAAVLG